MKEKQRILIVGAGREQIPAIIKAKEMGFEVLASDRNPQAPGFAHADHSFVVSTDDAAGNLKVARKYNIDGVLTLISETAVPVVAGVAQTLGIPGISPATVRWATDKIAMRRRFQEQAVPQPEFTVRETGNSATSVANRLGYPLVVKPPHNSGQRGVTLVEHETQLQAAVKDALLYAPENLLLFEQYQQGCEINVTAAVTDGLIHILSLSDRMTYPRPAFGVAYAHHYPARLNEKRRKKVIDCAKKAIAALGMQDGIAYPQIIINEKGVFLVEIAARIPGGNMREVALFASGIDLIEVAILQAVGKLHSLDCLTRHTQVPAFCARFLTTNDTNLPVGRVVSVTGLNEARKVQGIIGVECYLQEGDIVEEVRHSTHRYGVVMSWGANLQTATKRAEQALHRIRIIVR